MKMQCYVCGKPLGATFYLVSMQAESDRVFLVAPGCLALAQGKGVTACLVKRLK